MTAIATAEIGTCPACNNTNVALHNVQGLLVCEKCTTRRFSVKVRKSIQEAAERQMAKKRRDMWQKRLSVASRGVKAFEAGKFGEALKIFADYLAILEHHHRVPQGALQANMFDPKKDAPEILLIAGVYWDMAKIYDRMGTGHRDKLRHALNKFIEFSIDRPHAVLTAEALRKHIHTNSARSVEDFKQAHQVVAKGLSRCFIATAVLGPTAPELNVLRQFRDEVLLTSVVGRAFVRVYYATGPIVAHFVASRPRLGAFLAPAIQRLAQVAGRFLSRRA